MDDQSARRERRRHATADVLPGLYERVPMLVTVNLSVAALLVIALVPVAQAGTLVGWSGTTVGVLLLRLLLWQRYHADPRRHVRSPLWLSVLLATTAATGGCWGAAGVLFHGAGPIDYDLLIAFTLGGMTAGSAVALTAYLPLFFAFYLPATIPYCLRLAFSVEPGQVHMATLVAGFAIGIGVLAVNIHRSLRANEERYRRVVEDQSEMICRFRPDGTLTFVNGACARAFGFPRDELIGVDLMTLLPETAREERRALFASLTPERSAVTYEQKAIWPDGRVAWEQWRDRAIFDARGRLIELQSVGRDITARKEAEEELRRARDELGVRVDQRTRELRDTNAALIDEIRERRRVEAALRRSEDRLRVALQAARMGVWEQDLVGNALFWSPEMERLFGLPAGSFGGRFEDFLALVHLGDREKVRLRLATGPREDAAFDLEYRLIRPDGELRWVASFGEPVWCGGRAIKLAGVAMDITDRKLVEEQALRLANHDPLTGLPNRRLLEDRLEQAFATAERQRERVAVLLLDLDGFKHVNDSRGHPVGDKLLCRVAERLSTLVRASDTLARLGGDEFAVVQTGLEDEKGALVLARKLLRAMERPFVVDDEDIHASTSIGISLFPGHGQGVAPMLKCADLALYAAKAGGRNTVCTFQTWMTAAATARQSLEYDLRRALERDDLILHYQPILNLDSGRITGVEALLRWRQADGSLLQPEGFLPLAERTGLIRPLGQRVLAEACRQAVAWQRDGFVLRMAINLSAAQIRCEDDLASIASLIAAAGLDPRFLDFEITESLFVDPALRHRTLMLGGLVDLGAHLSLDRFGTGYASLASLKEVPADTIKIDRSFIRDLHRPDDQALLTAMLALGRSLGRRVIVEGVETPAQMADLHRLGCTDLQGFLIGRPRPAADLERFCQTWPERWAELQQSVEPGRSEPRRMTRAKPLDAVTN